MEEKHSQTQEGERALADFERTLKGTCLFGAGVPVTPLTGPFAEISLRVALDGLTPSPPELPALAGGRFGPFDLAGFEGTPEVKGNELKILVRERKDFEDARPSMRSMNEKMNLTAALTLQDGSSVTADLALFFIKETRFAANGGSHEEDGMLLLDHWIHGVPPLAWFGVVEGASFERGNLHFAEGDNPLFNGKVSHRNLRLEGNYLWHVIQRQSECVALIDPRGQPLDPKRIGFDFRALEVMLERPLRLGVLSGLDENGRTRCWSAPLTSGHRQTSSTGYYDTRPVPDGGRPELWEPYLFEKLAKAMAKGDPKPLFMATNALLDFASPGTIDGKYLTLQVTLEALCRYDEPDLPDLVKDRAAWLAWTEQHRKEIETFATDLKATPVLFEHVRQAFQQTPARDAVHAHLSRLGFQLPPEVQSEIPRRNQSAHRLLMNADDDRRDFHEDLNRLAIVRTLLLAVLAKRIGYDGPILGWNIGVRDGLPEWWPVTADHRVALERFHASRDAPPSTTGGSMKM